jgi:hypothetical protein
MKNIRTEMTSTQLAFHALGEIIYSINNKKKLEPQFLIVQHALNRLQAFEEYTQANDCQTLEGWLELERRSDINAYACILHLRQQIHALEKNLNNEKSRSQFTENILGNRITALNDLIKQIHDEN